MAHEREAIILLMKNSLHICSAPTALAGRATQRRFVLRATLALAAGLSIPGMAFAAPPAQSAPTSDTKSNADSKPMPLRIGRSVTFPLTGGPNYRIESGAFHVSCKVQDNTLTVRAIETGNVVLFLEPPGQKPTRIALTLIDNSTPAALTSAFGGDIVSPADAKTGKPSTATTVALDSGESDVTRRLVTRRALSQTTPPATTPTAPAEPTNANNAGGVGVPGPATAPTGVSAPDPLDSIPAIPTVPTTPGATVPSIFPPADNTTTTLPNPVAPLPALPAVPATNTAPATTTTPATATTPAVATQPAPTMSNNAGTTMAPTGPSVTRISPILPPPSPQTRPTVPYKTTSHIPKEVNTSGTKPSVEVSQGLARLISFPSNILSVFFSDPSVMDARAINARTIAVTGVGAGVSTLAVFTSQFPGDVIGRANIYRIQTVSRTGATNAFGTNRDPQVVETAIVTALGDPRIRTSVVRLPDGTLAARLTGTVRNTAEVEGAITTASFYVPRVLSSLYADPNAPSLDATLAGPVNTAPEAGLQDSLRRITGNDTIELIPLPTGLGFKAEVDSPEEADSLMQILPTLDRPVIPFIVIHGQPGTYSSPVPLLQGEDRQLTQKLQAVTGLHTVYAVRTSTNSVAIYGTVRDRAEYQMVQQYSYVVAQQAVPSATAANSQGGSVVRPLGTEGALPSYDPLSGYQHQLGVQLFVRITDPNQSAIRNVSVETSIVEITRTALKNLGVEFGSATTTGETSTAGTTTIVRDGAGNPVVDASGNIVTQTTGGTLTRTIDPGFIAGSILSGNGFAGFGTSGPNGSLGFVDPFRARLNALAQNGDVRVLAQPNVKTLEGMPAQITIGGERPVPSGAITNGAATNTVEFRRYGVIITMRPTVTDDNTIILQIRADVTQPDRTFEINLNGALIPGETVRSVDTTLSVKPGDTIVMGGLMSNEKRQQFSKVPILGDLPLIGSLFTSKRFENNESELAIFMRPNIENIRTTMGSVGIAKAAPGFPGLPSRQETSSLIFQDTSRQAK